MAGNPRVIDLYNKLQDNGLIKSDYSIESFESYLKTPGAFDKTLEKLKGAKLVKEDYTSEKLKLWSGVGDAGYRTNNPLNVKTQDPQHKNDLDYEGDGLYHKTFNNMEEGYQAGKAQLERYFNLENETFAGRLQAQGKNLETATMEDLYGTWASGANPKNVALIEKLLGVEPGTNLATIAKEKGMDNVALAMMKVESPDSFNYYQRLYQEKTKDPDAVAIEQFKNNPEAGSKSTFAKAFHWLDTHLGSVDKVKTLSDGTEVYKDKVTGERKAKLPDGRILHYTREATAYGGAGNVVAGGIGGGLINTVGIIAGALGDVGEAIIGEHDGWDLIHDNAIRQAAEEFEKTLKTNIPLSEEYIKRSQENIDTSGDFLQDVVNNVKYFAGRAKDAEFWHNEVSQLFESAVEMALPAIKVGSAAGKYIDKIDKINSLGKYGKKAAKGTASVLAYDAFNTTLESSLEAREIFKTAYEHALQEGLTEEEARNKAGYLASDAFVDNAMLIGSTNLLEGALLFSPFKGVVKSFHKIAAGASLEGFQEAGQFAIGKYEEARMNGELTDENVWERFAGITETLTRGFEEGDPELTTSIGLGMALGAGMHTGTQVADFAKKYPVKKSAQRKIARNITEIYEKDKEGKVLFKDGKPVINHDRISEFSKAGAQYMVDFEALNKSKELGDTDASDLILSNSIGNFVYETKENGKDSETIREAFKNMSIPKSEWNDLGLTKQEAHEEYISKRSWMVDKALEVYDNVKRIQPNLAKRQFQGKFNNIFKAELLATKLQAIEAEIQGLESKENKTDVDSKTLSKLKKDKERLDGLRKFYTEASKTFNNKQERADRKADKEAEETANNIKEREAKKEAAAKAETVKPKKNVNIEEQITPESADGAETNKETKKEQPTAKGETPDSTSGSAINDINEGDSLKDKKGLIYTVKNIDQDKGVVKIDDDLGGSRDIPVDELNKKLESGDLAMLTEEERGVVSIGETLPKMTTPDITTDNKLGDEVTDSNGNQYVITGIGNNNYNYTPKVVLQRIDQLTAKNELSEEEMNELERLKKYNSTIRVTPEADGEGLSPNVPVILDYDTVQEQIDDTLLTDKFYDPPTEDVYNMLAYLALNYTQYLDNTESDSNFVVRETIKDGETKVVTKFRPIFDPKFYMNDDGTFKNIEVRVPAEEDQAGVVRLIANPKTAEFDTSKLPKLIKDYINEDGTIDYDIIKQHFEDNKTLELSYGRGERFIYTIDDFIPLEVYIDGERTHMHVHITPWISGLNTRPELIKEQYIELARMRRFILSKLGKDERVTGEITGKKMGMLDRLDEPKPLSSFKFADAFNLPILIGRKKEEDQNRAIIDGNVVDVNIGVKPGDSPRHYGKLSVLVPYAVDENGDYVYHTRYVVNRKFGKDERFGKDPELDNVRRTLDIAIRGFVKDPAMSSKEAEGFENLNKAYNLKSESGINDYISNFMRSEGVERKRVAKGPFLTYMSSVKPGNHEIFVATINGEPYVEIAYSTEKGVDIYTNKGQFGTKKIEPGQLSAFIAKKEFNSNYNRLAQSLAHTPSEPNVQYLNEDMSLHKVEKYSDFILDRTFTNVDYQNSKSDNSGVYTPFFQGKISFNIDGFDHKKPYTEDVKESETITPDTPPINKGPQTGNPTYDPNDFPGEEIVPPEQAAESLMDTVDTELDDDLDADQEPESDVKGPIVFGKDIEEKESDSETDDDVIDRYSEGTFFEDEYDDIEIKTNFSIKGVPQYIIEDTVNVTLGEIAKEFNEVIEDKQFDKEDAWDILDSMRDDLANTIGDLREGLKKDLPEKKKEILATNLQMLENLYNGWESVVKLLESRLTSIYKTSIKDLDKASNQLDEDRIATINQANKIRDGVKNVLLSIPAYDRKGNKVKYILSAGNRFANLYKYTNLDNIIDVLFGELATSNYKYVKPDYPTFDRILQNLESRYKWAGDIRDSIRENEFIRSRFINAFYTVDVNYMQVIYKQEGEHTKILPHISKGTAVSKVIDNWRANALSTLDIVHRNTVDGKVIDHRSISQEKRDRLEYYFDAIDKGVDNLNKLKKFLPSGGIKDPQLANFFGSLIKKGEADLKKGKVSNLLHPIMDALFEEVGINLSSEAKAALRDPSTQLQKGSKSIKFNYSAIAYSDIRKDSLKVMISSLDTVADASKVLNSNIVKDLATIEHSYNPTINNERMFRDGVKSVANYQAPRLFYLEMSKLQDQSTNYLNEVLSTEYAAGAYWAHLIKARKLNYGTISLQAMARMGAKTQEQDIHNFTKKKFTKAMLMHFLVNFSTTKGKGLPMARFFSKAISDSKFLSIFETEKPDLFDQLKTNPVLTQVLGNSSKGIETRDLSMEDFMFMQLVQPEIDHIKRHGGEFYAIPGIDAKKFGFKDNIELANALSIVDSTERSQAIDVMTKFIQQEINNMKDQFKAYDIGWTGKRWNAVSKEAVDYYSSKIPDATPEIINDAIVQDMVRNYMIAHSNSSRLLYGHPDVYKKGTKAQTMDNMVKRIKMYASPRNLFDVANYIKRSGRNTINYIVANDIESPVEAMSFLAETLDDVEWDPNDATLSKEELEQKYPASYNYLFNSHADAQEFVHWKHHLNTLESLGIISRSEYNELYNAIQDRNLNNDQLRRVLGAFKPLYSNTIVEDGIAKKFYVKSSHIPIIPGYSLQLEQALDFMDKHNVDRIAMRSAAKLMDVVPMDIFNNDLSLKDLEAISKVSMRKLPAEGYGEQLNVPVKDTFEVSNPTQVQKGLAANIWNEIVEFKGKKLTVRQIERLRSRIYGKIHDHLTKNTIDRISEDGYTLKPSKLARVLAGELNSGRYTENAKKAIDLTGDYFTVPLWLSANFKQIEAIITAVINKGGVSRLKRPGMGLAQASSLGMGKFKSYHKSLESKIIKTKNFDSKGLKHGVESDGVIVSHIIVPWHYQESIEKFLDNNGRIDPKKLPDRFRKMFGFRIPNQHHSSQIVFEVVGYLPKAMGNVAYVPTEVVTQMGSDFDIDKINVMGRMWKIADVNGEPYIQDTDDTVSKLWNELLDTEIAIIGSNNKNIQRSVRSPLDKPAQDLAETAKTLTEARGKEIGDDASHVSPLYQTDRYLLGSEGNKLIGVMANALTFGFVLQDSEYMLGNEEYVPFAIKVGDEVVGPRRYLNFVYDSRTVKKIQNAFNKEYEGSAFVIVDGERTLHKEKDIPKEAQVNYRAKVAIRNLAEKFSERTGIPVEFQYVEIDESSKRPNSDIGVYFDESQEKVIFNQYVPNKPQVIVESFVTPYLKDLKTENNELFEDLRKQAEKVLPDSDLINEHLIAKAIGEVSKGNLDPKTGKRLLSKVVEWLNTVIERLSRPIYRKMFHQEFIDSKDLEELTTLQELADVFTLYKGDIVISRIKSEDTGTGETGTDASGTSRGNFNDVDFYEGDIKPEEGTVFVFGSNPEGRHGAGAAKIAKDRFGAILGQGEGLQGNSYALPTKDLRDIANVVDSAPYNKNIVQTPEGTEFVNVYRAEGKTVDKSKLPKAVSGSAGSWFTPDLKTAKSYLKGDRKLYKVAIPKVMLDQLLASRDGSKSIVEVQLPENIANIKQEIKSDKTRSISKKAITENISKLYETAKANPDKTFKVAYRNKGDETTLNGYSANEMIDMFIASGEIPSNVQFSKEWVDTYKERSKTQKELEKDHLEDTVENPDLNFQYDPKYDVIENDNFMTFMRNVSSDDLIKNNILKADEIKYKSDNTVGTLSVALDNQKDNILEQLHLNMQTAPVVTMMQLQGMDNNDHIFPLISQPVIKHFIDRVNIEGKPNIDTIYDEVVTGIVTKLGNLTAPDSDFTQFTKKGLIESIQKHADRKQDAQYYRTQLNAIRVFYKYYTGFQGIRGISSITNIHTKGGGKDLAAMRDTLNKYQKLMLSDRNTTVLSKGSYSHAVQKLHELSNVIESSNGNVTPLGHESGIFENLRDAMFDYYKTDDFAEALTGDAYQNITRAINNSIRGIVYAKVVSKIKNNTAHNIRTEYLVGNENNPSLAQTILNIKNANFANLSDSQKLRLRTNSFLNRLGVSHSTVREENKMAIPSIESTRTRDLDLNQIDRDVADLFSNPIELYDGYNTRDFVTDLALYSFSVGHANTGKSIASFIPQDLVKALLLKDNAMQEALGELKDLGVKSTLKNILFHNKDLAHQPEGNLEGIGSWKDGKLDFENFDVDEFVKKGWGWKSIVKDQVYPHEVVNYNGTLMFRRGSKYVPIEERGHGAFFSEYNEDGGTSKSVKFIDTPRAVVPGDGGLSKISSRFQGNTVNVLSSIVKDDNSTTADKITARIFTDVLLNKGFNPEVKIVKHSKLQSPNRKETYGAYVGNEILLSDKLLAGALPAELRSIDHLILHEIGHHITGTAVARFLHDKGLKTNEKLYNQSTKLTPEQSEAIERVYKAYEVINKGSLKDKYKRATKDFFEFTTEVLSNENFRNDIDKTHKAVDIFGKLVRFVKEMLGLEEEGSGLSQMLLNDIYTFSATGARKQEMYQDKGTLYTVVKIGDEVISVKAVDTNTNASVNYINAKEKYEHVKNFTKVESKKPDTLDDIFDSKVEETANYTFTTTKDIAGNERITIVNKVTDKVVTEADANYQRAQKELSDLRNGGGQMSLFFSDEKSEEYYKWIDGPLSKNQIDSRDLYYPDLFKVINHRMEKISEEIVSVKELKRSATRGNKKELIKREKELEKELARLLFTANKVAQMESIVDLVDMLADHENEFDILLAKDNLSSNEIYYLQNLHEHLSQMLTGKDSIKDTYFNKEVLDKVPEADLARVINTIDTFNNKLNRKYIYEINQKANKNLKKNLDPYSQRKIDIKDIKKTVGEDVNIINSYMLAADRSKDDMTNLLVKAMTQAMGKASRDTAKYHDRLQKAFSKAKYHLNKLAPKDALFGLWDPIVDKWGDLISYYSEEFIQKQRDASDKLKRKLAANPNDDKKKAIARREYAEWRRKNNVVMNPSLILEDELGDEIRDNLKIIDPKFGKKPTDAEREKHKEYIKKTVGPRRYDLFIKRMESRAEEYLAAYELKREEIEAEATARGKSGADWSKYVDWNTKLFVVMNNPIVTSEASFDNLGGGPGKLSGIPVKYRKAFEDSKAYGGFLDKGLYTSESYAISMPLRFTGDKSRMEMTGDTGYYSPKLQKLIDTNQTEILELYDIIQEALYEGMKVLPEHKRRGLKMHHMPFYERDVLQTVFRNGANVHLMGESVKKAFRSFMSIFGLNDPNDPSRVNELPLDTISSSILNNKAAEVSRRAHDSTKAILAKKNIYTEEDLRKAKLNKKPDSDTNYWKIYEQERDRIKSKMVEIQNFDLVKSISLYKASVASYKHKTEAANELGLLGDAVFKRLDEKDQDGGARHRTSGQLKYMYKQFQNLGVNVPVISSVKVGKVYTELESQIKEDLEKQEKVWSDLYNSLKEKEDTSEETLEGIQKKLAKIQADKAALGKEGRPIDGILKLFLMMTQFLGLGFNYPGFSPNFIAGQINNRYEAADGRVFTIDNYKESFKAYMKHSGAARFLMGVGGMFAGFSALAGLGVAGGVAGVAGGFVAGNLLMRFAQTKYKNDKSFQEVARTVAFVGVNDIMQVVQNEAYKPFKSASLISRNKGVNSFLNNKWVKSGAKYLDAYKATNEAETLNQHILIQSIMRNTKLKDKNGNEITLLDAIGLDGDLDREIVGDMVEHNNTMVPLLEYQIMMANELRVAIRRTQGDYREGMTVAFKKNVLGKSLVQFRTWLAESVAMDWEDYSRDVGITNRETNDALELKGRFRSAFNSMGVMGGLSLAAVMRITPLLFVSTVTGSAIPALVYASLLTGIGVYAKKKGFTGVKKGVTTEFLQSIYKNFPLIRRLYKDAKPENDYFRDLVDDEFSTLDAANMRALAAKMRYASIMLFAYGLGTFAQLGLKDEDDEVSKMARRAAFITLNIAGRSYSDNTLTIDPQASIGRFNNLSSIMPAYRSMKEFGQVANPATWTKVYQRSDKRRGYKKGDLKILKEIGDIMPVWNKFDQIDYMSENEYSIFSLDD